MKKQTLFLLISMIVLLTFSFGFAAEKAQKPKAKPKAKTEAKTEAKSEVKTDELAGVKNWVTQTFPNFKIEEISKSPIPGVYEIIGENGQITYAYPGKDSKEGYLIFGEIWTTQGVSLTGKKREELMLAKLKDIPVKNAVKFGTGKKVVYLFTDPDCPYCRQAHQQLKEFSDKVTVYNLFVPFHPGADKKSMYVICSLDSTKALNELMSGALDRQEINLSDECIKKAKPIIDENMEYARKIGLRGTPLFYVEGKAYFGAQQIKQIVEGQ